jgi:ketosteroid isomerase-like protein
MTTQTSIAADEAPIRNLLEKRAAAIRAKDIAGTLSPWTPDVVHYDLPPPLQYVGAEAHNREVLRDWFDSWKGPIGYDLHDFSITAGEGLAYGYGLVHMRGTRTDGEETDVWVRQTLCLRKVGGVWKIVHEHTSVPFYMDGSYKAAVDLKP